MKKEETKEQVFEEQIKAQEESEAAAENIDSVPEPEEELTQFQPTAEELKKLNKDKDE